MTPDSAPQGSADFPTLRVDPGSPVPIYVQLSRQIEELVLEGVLAPGERLPSIRELAARARINRNTAARVIGSLESEGLLETRTGRGTFVASNAERWSRRERRKRLERTADRLLHEATAAGVSVDELMELLRRRAGANAPGAPVEIGSDHLNEGESA